MSNDQRRRRIPFIRLGPGDAPPLTRPIQPPASPTDAQAPPQAAPPQAAPASQRDVTAATARSEGPAGATAPPRQEDTDQLVPEAPGAATETDLAERRKAVLESLRTATEAARSIAVEALVLSGLSDDEAVRQAQAVAGGGAEIEPLHCTVERLDLGSLANDQPARAEFELTGGPGRLLVQGAPASVTPQQFGPGVTRVSLEIPPQPNGVVLTSLLAVSPAETLEIPLFARWSAVAEPAAAAPAGAPAAPAPRPAAPSAQRILVRTSVVVTRVMGFPRALALQRAIEQIPGVAEVKALGFEHNTLNLSVQHEATANLAELVSHVPGFQLTVTNSSLGRLQLASEGR